MVNKKITELTELTTPVSTDIVAIVDVSDTTMAASGTTKKITFSNIQTNLSITESQISDLGSYLLNVVEDTTPQLGGNLDAQNNDITAVQNIDYDYSTGEVTDLGNLGATETIDFNGGTYQTGTLDSAVTITHSNETTGRKITLVLSYDGTAQRAITWSDVDKWMTNGGTAPTSPSAAGQVLIVTLLYIGTTCYGAASTNY